MNLLDVLNPGAQMRWVVARVASHDPVKKKVVLVIGATSDAEAIRIPNVSYLKSYTPAVGDVVHVLVQPNIGALVLGAS